MGRSGSIPTFFLHCLEGFFRVPYNGPSTLNLTLNLALKLGIARVMSATGFFHLLKTALVGRGAVIFNLHRVLPLQETERCYNSNLVLTPESLDEFVRFIKRRLPVVPLAELVDGMLKNRLKPCCALTFDDGWEDNYRIAFPILDAHRVPFTIFLPTQMIGTTRRLPEERFWRVMSGDSSDECQEHLKKHLISAGMITEGQPAYRYAEARGLFKQLSHEGKMQFLDGCEKLYGTPSTESVFLDWHQVRLMRDKGVTFGSHTMRHTNLTVNTSDFMKVELVGSKQKIKEETGIDAEFFAYPNGMYNATAIAAVREAGYKAAFTTERAIVNSLSNLLTLPRVPLSNDMVNDAGQKFSLPMAELQLVYSYITKGDALDY
jgi:peptidoglycan/xylan/chitin deacetylase (PgdA/CDA1 family)